MVIARAALAASLLLGAIGADPVQALEPEETVVLANRNASASMDLARYYMQRRGIPASNLIRLWAPDRETCSRRAYEKKVAGPARRRLAEIEREHAVRCLLLMYGLPIRVAAPEPEKADLQRSAQLRREQKTLSTRLKATDIDAALRKDLQNRLESLRREIKRLAGANRSAALDSEIALLRLPDHPLEGRLANPFFLGNRGRTVAIEKKAVLMVSRLDGPDPETVRRLIDDALQVESEGLQGTAYFDARWADPGDKRVKGYAFYDRSLHQAAEVLRSSGRMPVVVNAGKELFGPGECPGAALYCGWYSLGRYVDAFEWKRGAVGYHIASSECATLKAPGSRVWCKKMIEDGVAATLGPVGEPYVDAFPVPALFFKLLTQGYLTLAECYLVSLPWLSWRMILVGDPLYRPFAVLR